MARRTKPVCGDRGGAKVRSLETILQPRHSSAPTSVPWMDS